MPIRSDRRIRIIIVDAKGFRSALVSRLLNKPPLAVHVIGATRDCKTALKLAAITKPDVALVSVEMAQKTDRTVDALVNQRITKVLLLSAVHGDRDQAAVLRGALGVVYTDESTQLLYDAIRSVHQGHVWVDVAAARRLFIDLCRHYTKAQSSEIELLRTRRLLLGDLNTASRRTMHH